MSSAVTVPSASTSGIISSTTAIHESASYPSGIECASNAVDSVVCATCPSSSRASLNSRSSASRESP